MDYPDAICFNRCQPWPTVLAGCAGYDISRKTQNQEETSKDVTVKTETMTLKHPCFWILQPPLSNINYSYQGICLKVWLRCDSQFDLDIIAMNTNKTLKSIHILKIRPLRQQMFPLNMSKKKKSLTANLYITSHNVAHDTFYNSLSSSHLLHFLPFLIVDTQWCFSIHSIHCTLYYCTLMADNWSRFTLNSNALFQHGDSEIDLWRYSKKQTYSDTSPSGSTSAAWSTSRGCA